MRVFIWIALTGLAFSACGPSPRAPGLVPLPQERAAGLKLRVLPAGADPEFPADEGAPEAASAQEGVAQGDEITFKRNILLRDPRDARKGRPLFLVWSEDALGSPIRDAYFFQRSQNGDNSTQGEPAAVRASYDDSTRRWFIPFEKVFGGRLANADPAKTYHLTLDLELEDRARPRIRVYYRASGPLVVRASPLDSSRWLSRGAAEPAAFAAQALEGKLAVASETYENPSLRELFLVVPHARLRSEVVLSVYGERRRWGGSTSLPPPKEPEAPQLFEARAPLRIASVHARRAGGLEVLPVQDGRDVRLAIGPGESLTLQWMAAARPHLPRCAPPLALERVYRWKVKQAMSCSRGECAGPLFDDREERRKSSWRIVGASLSGQLRRQVRLADPEGHSAPEPELRTQGLLLEEPAPVAAFRGHLPRDVAARDTGGSACQGTF